MASGTSHAFVWTAAGGMVDLGTLGGNTSTATAISADGTVIVGQAAVASGSGHAFRWTSGGGMVDLGTLGGTVSIAQGVSADGGVIAGQYTLAGLARAFRWTSTGGMADLGTLGGNLAIAWGVSGDGATIVGTSRNNVGTSIAFLWTEATNTMTSLGTLTTNGVMGSSSAYAVNYDGTVVVGSGQTGGAGQRAFRWTAETGMLSVEDWLRASGVDVATDFTRVARGVSDDGTTIVGQTASSTAFIARVSPFGSGVIDVNEYAASLAAKPNARIGLENANLVLHGAHGDPMRNLLEPGKRSFSMTSDAGYDRDKSADGGLGVGEFALGAGLEGGVTARLGFGGAYTRQNIDTGGHFTEKNLYIVPEVSVPVFQGLHATVSGYYARGKLDFRRGYLNAGIMDYSRGETDIETWGGRLRFDWVNAFALADWAFTPYASLTYLNSRMDGYTETGGGFPVVFDAGREHSTVVRAGLDTVHSMTDSVRLLGRLEAAYQFEKETSAIGGNIIGLSGFRIAGNDVDQLWLRGGLGVEMDAGGGTASLNVNVTTQGADPTVWLRTGWKMSF